MSVIDSFSGEYRWLSNFWMALINKNGLIFPSSEHLYQAAKCKFDSDVLKFTANITPGQAKRLGQKVPMREDWNDVRISIMAQIIRLKFDQNLDLKQKLKATKDVKLIEGNTWGDTFWGVYNGKGENNLGKILMEYRDTI